MIRRSPVKHKVRSHKRSGAKVDEYERGHGKHSPDLKSSTFAKRLERLVNSHNRNTSDVTRISTEDKMRSQWKGSNAKGLKEPGQAGDTDFSFHNKQIEPTSRYDPDRGNYNASTDKDVLDKPSKNMLSYIGPSERKIYVGDGNSDTRKDLLSKAKQVIGTNFTVNEVRDMQPIYLSVQPSTSSSYAGLYHKFKDIPHATHVTGKIRYPAVVKINDKFLNDDIVLTHELVHAMTFGGQYAWTTLDRDEMEKRTELHARMRVPYTAMMEGVNVGAGYYQHIPEVYALMRAGKYDEYRKIMRQYEIEDRKTMFGTSGESDKRWMGKGLKGKAVEEALTKHYHETHIGRAHFSPAEALDRYFYVKQDEEDVGDTIHISYRDHIASDAEALRDVRREYPKADIWEWRDGVKVKVYDT